MPKFHLAIATAALCSLIFSTGARAQDAVPDMSGEELRKVLSGNTVWVLRTDMTRGDEYHLPDGRVFGFNGVETIENGCWDIVGKEVCYYYKDDRAKGRAHCWTFKQIGSNQFRLKSTYSDFGGFGAMEPGNPRNYTDNGRPWECKGLSSRRNMSPRIAGR